MKRKLSLKSSKRNISNSKLQRKPPAGSVLFRKIEFVTNNKENEPGSKRSLSQPKKLKKFSTPKKKEKDFISKISQKLGVRSHPKKPPRVESQAQVSQARDFMKKKFKKKLTKCKTLKKAQSMKQIQNSQPPNRSRIRTQRVNTVLNEIKFSIKPKMTKSVKYLKIQKNESRALTTLNSKSPHSYATQTRTSSESFLRNFKSVKKEKVIGPQYRSIDLNFGNGNKSVKKFFKNENIFVSGNKMKIFKKKIEFSTEKNPEVLHQTSRSLTKSDRKKKTHISPRDQINQNDTLQNLKKKIEETVYRKNKKQNQIGKWGEKNSILKHSDEKIRIFQYKFQSPTILNKVETNQEKEIKESETLTKLTSDKSKNNSPKKQKIIHSKLPGKEKNESQNSPSPNDLDVIIEVPDSRLVTTTKKENTLRIDKTNLKIDNLFEENLLKGIKNLSSPRESSENCLLTKRLDCSPKELEISPTKLTKSKNSEKEIKALKMNNIAKSVGADMFKKNRISNTTRFLKHTKESQDTFKDDIESVFFDMKNLNKEMGNTLESSESDYPTTTYEDMNRKELEINYEELNRRVKLLLNQNGRIIKRNQFLENRMKEMKGFLEESEIKQDKKMEELNKKLKKYRKRGEKERKKRKETKSELDEVKDRLVEKEKEVSSLKMVLKLMGVNVENLEKISKDTARSRRYSETDD